MDGLRIIDMHCDTISRILGRQREEQLLAQQQKQEEQFLTQSQQELPHTSLRENDLDVDLMKMKKSGYLLQNFAVFVDCRKVADPYEEAMEEIRLFRREMEANEDLIRPVTSYLDILVNGKEGRMSALLTLEEGEVCRGSIEELHHFYDQGVRMMTLTWNYANSLGYPNIDNDKAVYRGPLKKKHSRQFKPELKNGLTHKGLEFIKEMENLGMIIDVSHLSDAGFYDVLINTRKPFVASHSNARQVSPWVRNLTDDMIRKLANRGGVMGLNYCMDFLADHSRSGKRMDYLDFLARHAQHILNVGGTECLGLGSDFDGIPRNVDLEDAGQMESVYHAFKKVGITTGQIEKIFYKNVLNLYSEILG